MRFCSISKFKRIHKNIENIENMQTENPFHAEKTSIQNQRFQGYTKILQTEKLNNAMRPFTFVWDTLEQL